MGPVGTYNFTVYNNAKGLAQMNAVTNSFTFPLVTTSITPTYGGVGGGVKITITGNGFSQQTQVLVDNITCPIFYLTYNSVICITPPNVIYKLSQKYFKLF